MLNAPKVYVDKRSRHTVVLIDGSVAAQQLFRSCAATRDLELKIYPSSTAAMPYLTCTQPDLLFMDIILPDKDGLTFLMELRKSALHQDTRVVMITAKDYAQDRVLAKELGVLEFVPKPMGLSTIQDLITKFTTASDNSNGMQ